MDRNLKESRKEEERRAPSTEIRIGSIDTEVLSIAKKTGGSTTVNADRACSDRRS